MKFDANYGLACRGKGLYYVIIATSSDRICESTTSKHQHPIEGTYC